MTRLMQIYYEWPDNFVKLQRFDEILFSLFK
jgi:hypothetical protein